jgi:hypothetical protein
MAVYGPACGRRRRPQVADLVQQLLEVILLDRGGDEAAALEHRPLRPDAILLGLIMPGLDGFACSIS